MQHRSIVIACAFAVLASLASGADDIRKGPELVFDPPEGAQAFEAGKAAFKEKKYDAANEQFGKARKTAKSKTTQQEVERWVKGVAGMKDLAVLERYVDKEPGKAYAGGQRQLLVYIATPAAECYRQLIAQLENPEKKLVCKFECFEDTTRVYEAALGRTYVNKVNQPQFVIEGNYSLKWEYKVTKEASRAFRVRDDRVRAADWSEYDYLGFWMYGVADASSQIQLCLVTERMGEAPKDAKKKAGAKLTVDGFQASLPAHTGWRFIVVALKDGLEGTAKFMKVGAGDLKKVTGLQFQLPSSKKFTTYLDNFVLFKNK
jgi:hypothetical protein